MNAPTSGNNAAGNTTRDNATSAVESPFDRFSNIPEATGLYNPENEKDACGLAVIATLRGEPGHDIVDHALTALRNLEHRGAVGADEGTGDGAGLLTQVPDEFFRAVVGFDLPPAGQYAVGTAFLPAEGREEQTARAGLEASADARFYGARSVDGLAGVTFSTPAPLF